MTAPYSDPAPSPVAAVKDGTEVSTAVLVVGALAILFAIGKGFSGVAGSAGISVGGGLAR